MKVRYWYTWRGHEKEYIDIEEDKNASKEDLILRAQRHAEEMAEAEGWIEFLDETPNKSLNLT